MKHIAYVIGLLALGAGPASAAVGEASAAGAAISVMGALMIGALVTLSILGRRERLPRRVRVERDRRR